MSNENIVNQVIAEQTTPSQSQSNLTQESLNAPGFGERSEPSLERPDWVPEKFYSEGVIDYKGLAKSYSELEKKQSIPTPQPKVEEATRNDKQIHDVSKVVGSVPGVVPDRAQFFTKEIIEKGQLSPASYTELAAIGYSKDMVDIYITGLQKDRYVEQAVQQARVSDSEVSAITQSIGGQKNLDEMLNWAKTNLSDAERAAYDSAVDSNNPATVRLAVKGLYQSFNENHGKSPNYVDVGGHRLPGTPGAEPFGSQEEVIAIMSSYAYENDPAVRAKVQARLAVSGGILEAKNEPFRQGRVRGD